ncbi:MAG: M20 family metallopeptidase [Gammaproteobacteria bacterium]|nr:M20 family metallopeptidase [Gammaproteobacteria bacterium]
MSGIQQKIKDNFNLISEKWDADIIPQLENYIRIPNKSPMFDRNWEANGYMSEAMMLIKDWCEKQTIKNMKIELLKIENRTPVLLIDIPGDSEETILLYGHMDKQPEMVGWHDDLGPWKPVLKDGKLYGRGGADDGYAVFSALTAIAHLQSLSIPHARCVVLIEASEESGSVDLPPYLELIKEQMGSPDLIICLDSESGNYEQLWGTTSLRGLIGGTLKIDTLENGIHSGINSGVVPSVFHILRLLLDRIEDPNNGKIGIDELRVKIPADRLAQIREAANTLGGDIIKRIPFLEGVQPLCHDPVDIILNRTWEPALSLVGMDGVPAIENAGNVTLPSLSVKLSMRVPPTCDVKKASAALKKILEVDPPFNAKVHYEAEDHGAGWNSPELAPWLAKANDDASELFYGKKAAYIGIGASIPFMGMLGEMFPKAQYLITGVLGPQSNAHGPNEFLHIDYVKKLTGCVASLIAAHYAK